MHDSNLHINNKLNEYPNPEVPVDKAWESMEILLDQEDKKTEPARRKGIHYRFFRPRLLMYAGLVGILCFLYYYFEHYQTKENISSVKVVQELRGAGNLKNGSANNQSAINSFNAGKKIDSNNYTTSFSGKKSKNNSAGNSLMENGTNNQGINSLHNDYLNKAHSLSADVEMQTSRMSKKDFGKLSAKRTSKQNFIIHNKQTGNNKNYPLDIYSKENDDKSKKLNQLSAINTFKSFSSNSLLLSSIKDSILNNIVDDKKENIVHNENNLSYNKNDSLNSFSVKQDADVRAPKDDKNNEVQNQKISANKATASIAKNNNFFMGPLSFELQWQCPIPLLQNGFNNYFTNSNGNSNFYNILIPSVYVSKQMSSKSSVSLLINPAQQLLLKDNLISSTTGIRSVTDSTPVILNKKILKIISASVALQYDYQFNNKWMIAAGIAYSLPYKELFNTEMIKQTDSSFISNSIYGIKKSSSDWEYVPSSILSTQVRLNYCLKKYAVGIGLTYPITKTSEYFLNYDITLRYKLFEIAKSKRK